MQGSNLAVANGSLYYIDRRKGMDAEDIQEPGGIRGGPETRFRRLFAPLFGRSKSGNRRSTDRQKRDTYRRSKHSKALPNTRSSLAGKSNPKSLTSKCNIRKCLVKNKVNLFSKREEIFYMLYGKIKLWKKLSEKQKVNPEKLMRAKELRRNMTKAEAILWNACERINMY